MLYSSSAPRKSFRDVVRHFSPAWFAVNMGTGAMSNIFHAFPYGGHSMIMNGFALAFFFLNLLFFIIFLSMSIACYVMFPRIWRSLLHHPVQSLYLGCFPMGADTLITVGIVVVSQYWGFGGTPFVYVLWAFWWLDAIFSFLCCFGLVYIMATHHDHSMANFTPMWLLPVITLIVCSTTGQLLAQTLIPIHLSHAFLTMGVSIVMSIIGLSLALMILTVYIRRIVVDGLPDVGMALTSFIALGPWGQAGYSILVAGQNFKMTLPWGSGSVVGDELTGRILNMCCFFASFILWSLGVCWLLLSLVAVADVFLRGHRISFKLSTWGIVFPNSVQAVLTMQLAVALDSAIFRIIGSVYGAAVILIWFILAMPTFTQVLDGSIFCVPYVDDDLCQPTNQVGDTGEKAEKYDQMKNRV